MKYLYDVPFGTPAATDKYREGWDAVFAPLKEGVEKAKRDESERLYGSVLPGDDCPCESGKAFARCHGIEDDPRDE